MYHTGAPCAPEVKRQMIEWWGPVIHELYSATEAGGLGCFVTGDEWLAKPGTVGKPLPVMAIEIVSDEGELLPAGEVGTVYMRNLIGGDFEYHGAPDKTAAAHREPGVMTVGDVGYLDEDGYLFLCDRKIDMIISGGVNIYPAEIEAVLVNHPPCSTPPSSASPTTSSGRRSRRWSSWPRARSRQTSWRPRSRPTPGSTWPATRCRARSTSPTSSPARRRGSW